MMIIPKASMVGVHWNLVMFSSKNMIEVKKWQI